MEINMKSYIKSDATFLKVKLKSLAAEQVIIRKEERKALEQWRRARAADAPAEVRRRLCSRFTYLDLHRKRDVRGIIRENHLAASFLRGTAYHECEQQCAEPPDFRMVLKHVRRFCPEEVTNVEDAFAEWVWCAIRHLELHGHRRSSISFEREKEPALKVPA